MPEVQNGEYFGGTIGSTMMSESNGNDLSSRNNHKKEERVIEDATGKTMESAIRTGTPEPNENSSSSSIVHQRDAILVGVDGHDHSSSVAFLVTSLMERHHEQRQEGKI